MMRRIIRMIINLDERDSKGRPTATLKPKKIMKSYLQWEPNQPLRIIAAITENGRQTDIIGIDLDPGRNESA